MSEAEFLSHNERTLDSSFKDSQNEIISTNLNQSQEQHIFRQKSKLEKS